ncbi:MAG: peroxidase-related enzyme [Proteobacteria bacterium]|nr:peroxidase-related enzyme [Pseudomonadota bacterium]
MTDTIDTLAPMDGAPHAQAVRQQRSKAVTATQACEDLLLAPDLPGGLALAERLAVAQAVAGASGVTALAAHYGARLAKVPAPAQDGRWQAITHFTDLLATRPAAADRAALLALPAAGLATEDVVLLAQLIGFAAYQARLVAGVAALCALGPAFAGGAQPAPTAPEAPFVHPANLPAPGEPLRINGYTSETLDWKAWLPVVDPATASAEQIAVLDASHPKARQSDFYLVLAHQPRVLAERSQAFNAIMYAPAGLPRAERELATTVVSRINGCVYCASVHAQRFEQLAKRNDVIAQIFTDPDGAGTNGRERAIVQASSALTRSPGTFGAQHLAPLRSAGLNDLELLDTVHAVALFAWANRLMLNLGEAVHPLN